MSLFKAYAKVRHAKAEVHRARRELAEPAAALLVRGHDNPLTTMGLAAGAGFIMGSLGVHPLRVPGLGSLLGGGLAEAVAHGTRLVAELGLGGDP